MKGFTVSKTATLLLNKKEPLLICVAGCAAICAASRQPQNDGP